MIDSQTLAQQRATADALCRLYDQGWTLDQLIARFKPRHDMTRWVMEISWSMWNERQAAAIPVEVPELVHSDKALNHWTLLQFCYSQKRYPMQLL